MDRRNGPWIMLLIALALTIFGVFLMFESSDMLFEMNPSSLVAMTLATLFVFSGIVLIVIALAAIAFI